MTLEKKCVLLLDDDAVVRSSLGNALMVMGCEVLPARNGQEALTLAQTRPVDLALVDLKLPDGSGWDTFERLSANNPLMPIIIVTARPNQLFASLAAGVGALMEKPVSLPRLFETMQRLLEEPPDARLARLAGKAGAFHYYPTNDALCVQG